jgi:hypothetical protein
MCLVTPITTSTDCDFSRAGLKTLWAIDCGKVVDLTIDPDDRIVTGITLAAGESFKRIEFERNTAFLTQSKSVVKSSVNYVQSVTIYEAGLSNEVRNALEDINCVCCLHVIAEDNSGNRWYLGISYYPSSETWESEDMRTGDGSANTGTDPTADSAEYLETFVANTFNYGLKTTIDPDVVAGPSVMIAAGGTVLAPSGVAFA